MMTDTLYRFMDRRPRELSATAGMLVEAVRAWASACVAGLCPLRRVASSFMLQGMMPALRPFHMLMAQFGHGPGRPVCVGREGLDQRLSDDEALLMAALAAAQAGDLATGEACLRQVCDRARVPMAVDALRQLAAELGPGRALR
jgi:hypothetical protein